jgi:transcriptional regulator with XRE-family HTH domain
VSKTTQREDLHASILDVLHQERVRIGLSMNALAERSGLNQSAVSLIERRLRSPNLETLLRLADALEIDLWKLIKRATEKAKAAKE